MYGLKEIGDRCWWREDHCALCKCTRLMTRKNKAADEELHGYVRYMEQYHLQEPLCWGGREPT